MYLYLDERSDIRWNIAWALRAQAIFHGLSRLDSSYKHYQLKNYTSSNILPGWALFELGRVDFAYCSGSWAYIFSIHPVDFCIIVVKIMTVSVASTKSCTFYVQIFCPSFNVGRSVYCIGEGAYSAISSLGSIRWENWEVTNTINIIIFKKWFAVRNYLHRTLQTWSC